MSDSTRAALLDILAAAMRSPAFAESATDETPLLGSETALDSLAVLEVVVAVEERLGVVIAADDVAPEHFATVGRLVALVASRRK